MACEREWARARCASHILCIFSRLFMMAYYYGQSFLCDVDEEGQQQSFCVGGEPYAPDFSSPVPETLTPNRHATPAQTSHGRMSNPRSAPPSHPYYPPNVRRTNPSWFESTESQIKALVASQSKLMAVVENVVDRVSGIEKAVSTRNSASATSSSQEDKVRVPPQLSVSLT